MIANVEITPPVSGDQRKQLVHECTNLLASPEFNAPDFRDLLEKMIDLRGYGPGKYSRGSIETTPFVDRKYRRAISISKISKDTTSPPTLWVFPDWEALPKSKRDAVYQELTVPYTIEHADLTYLADNGFTYPLGGIGGSYKAVIEYSHRLHNPPGYNPKYISYGIGRDAKHDNWRATTDPLMESVTLSQYGVRQLGGMIWKAFLNSNDQIPTK